MDYHLETASFDELLSFYFDHPVTGTTSFWYEDAEVLYDPANNARFFIRLFEDPFFLLQKYDHKKLDQGFWTISGHGFDGNVHSLIFDHEDLSLDLRKECICAMVSLYEKLFAIDPIGESSAFWWNHFTHPFRSADNSRQRLDDTVFETLLRILRLDSVYCQSCAVAGLERLRHPNTAIELRGYLSKHGLDASIRKQIRRVIEQNPPMA